MSNIRRSVLLATLALLVITLLQHLKGSAGEAIQGLTHAAQFGRENHLVENVERIKPGNIKQVVERILGEADSVADREWTYYLDEHSGYIVNFDGIDRVVSVNAWVS